MSFILADLRQDLGIELDTSGRLTLFIKLLLKAKLKEQLCRLFGRDQAETLLQLMLAIVVGALDMEEVDYIGHDPISGAMSASIAVRLRFLASLRNSRPLRLPICMSLSSASYCLI